MLASCKEGLYEPRQLWKRKIKVIKSQNSEVSFSLGSISQCHCNQPDSSVAGGNDGVRVVVEERQLY